MAKGADATPRLRAISFLCLYSLTYGNLASMIILMLWMYMASLALLLGCKINAIRHPLNSD